MCGIFFMYYVNGSNYFTETQTSYELLKSRGPDRGYIEYGDKFVIGFRRLCINDTSILGDQPMISDQVMLVCNGEIFNYKDLISKHDLVCSSQSDCEVLLRMYEKGLLTVENLVDINGDFACLIYDKKTNLIYLIRDRMGVRPLFYGYTKEGDLVVASEIKCMSMCTTIEHVLPGTMMVFAKTNGKIMGVYHRYYSFPMFTISKSCEPLRQLLITSVKDRLMSDRPIGCLLSGGLDSSIITAILCKLIGGKNVRTYSIGMEGSLDLRYAREVANYLQTNHTEIKFTPQEGILALPEVIYALESYDITTVRASVGMYLLGKYISQNTQDKVIFSGEGSDELMCGYLYFHYAKSGADAHDESIRLLKNVYKYDVLRSDICMSENGLELRVPFLDKNVIDFCTTIHGDLKKPSMGVEKTILRYLFADYLPSNVINRKKDGFSDGVGPEKGTGKSWYEYIREYTDNIVPDSEVAGFEFGKEAYYYKKIYLNYFPYYPKPIDTYWMPKWVELKDKTNPSGRILEAYPE